MDQVFEETFLLELPRKIKTGFLSDVRSEQRVIEGNTTEQSVSRATPADLYKGIKDIMLQIGADAAARPLRRGPTIR
jgi:hypothetical protein